MEMPNVVRVYRVEDDFLEIIDGKRCLRIYFKEEERFAHIAEGSFLHVHRDYMGNIVSAAPLPEDDDYILFEEENPKKDETPEIGVDYLDLWLER